MARAILAVTLALVLLAVSGSYGQQPANVYRLGFLEVAAPPASDRTPQNCPAKGDSYWQALVEGLRERGYVQGRNLVIECRYTEGQEERALTLAAELVNLNVDLLVAVSTRSVRAAKRATTTIPIVMVGVINPAGRGLVDSLARPGGNITGLSDDAGMGIFGKRLQLLKEAIPQASRVAVLTYDPQGERAFLPAVEAAASALHMTLQVHLIRQPEELESAFATMTK